MDDILSPKNDIVFWMLFCQKHAEKILKPFLISMFDLPADEYETIEVLDPHTPIDAPGDKRGVMDVLLHTKNGAIIHIEIQLRPFDNMHERVVFYHSKVFAAQLSEGDGYGLIKRTITLLITDYPVMPEEKDYFNRYPYCNPKTGIIFSNISEIYTLELPKLPAEWDGNPVWVWGSFLKAKKTEEFEMLSDKHKEVHDAVIVLKELSRDERTRMLAEREEKIRRDEESMVSTALRQGVEMGEARGIKIGEARVKRESAISLIRLNAENAFIARALHMTEAEVEELRQLAANSKTT